MRNTSQWLVHINTGDKLYNKLCRSWPEVLAYIKGEVWAREISIVKAEVKK